MTNAITGKAGVVSIGSTVNEVTEWSLNLAVEAVEATSMSSSGNREYIDGLKGADGSFTTLRILNKTGTQAAATFQAGASTSASEPKYTGSILITSEPIAVPVDGRVQYAYTFNFTGAITVATS